MKVKPLNLIICVLVLLIVFNISLPEDVFKMVNQKEVKIGAVVLSLLVAYKQPLIGIMGLISFFVLIHNSQSMERKKSFGEGPSEKYKKQHMEVMNDSFPATLEEEIVKGVDTDKYKCSMPDATYKPVLEKSCNNSVNV
jgi:hypothetical protein